MTKVNFLNPILVSKVSLSKIGDIEILHYACHYNNQGI